MQEHQASLVIPAYNEENAITPLLEGLISFGFHEKYQIIFIDDGSDDKTYEIISQYPVKIFRHNVNKGYGAALKTGIRRASCEKIIIMDSDGQHDPAELMKVVDLLDDHDMVIGERNENSHQVSNRRLGKRLIRKTGEYLVEQKLPDFNSGYRGFRRELIYPMLHMMPNGFSFSTTSTLAFLKEGYSIATIPIEVKKRSGRESSVKFVHDGSKTFLLLFRIIMLFNPLKVFFPASVISFIAGLTFGTYGYLVFSRFSNGAVILIILGMLLFFFGLLADQIAIMNRKQN